MSEPTPQQPRLTPGRTGDQLPEPATVAVPLDGRRRRLLFRATHRGTQETDRLVGGFVARGIGEFTAAEIDALEEILDMPEPDLADFLIGRRPIPPETDLPMLRAMKDAARR